MIHNRLAVFFVIGFSSLCTVQAEESCKNISYTGGGQLMLLDSADCSAAINTLSKSQQFPEIFLANPAKLLGVCYASIGSFPAQLGSQKVNIKLTSVWTNEFNPAPPINDALGTVVTQWEIQEFSNKHKTIAYMYTHDTIDLANSTELDVVAAGAGKLAGVTGAVRINSAPDPTSFINGLPGQLTVMELSGSVCSKTMPHADLD